MAFHQIFHVFSGYVVCYFLLLTRMYTCEKILSARRVISPGVFIRGGIRDSPPRRYIGYSIYRLFKTIYRLGDIWPVSYIQVGDILLKSAKNRYIFYPSYIGWPIYRFPYRNPPKAIVSDTRNGSHKMLYQHIQVMKSIWGGSPNVEPVAFGIDSILDE